MDRRMRRRCHKIQLSAKDQDYDRFHLAHLPFGGIGKMADTPLVQSAIQRNMFSFFHR